MTIRLPASDNKAVTGFGRLGGGLRPNRHARPRGCGREGIESEEAEPGIRRVLAGSATAER